MLQTEQGRGVIDRNMGDLKAATQDDDFLPAVYTTLPPLLLPDTWVFILGEAVCTQAKSSSLGPFYQPLVASLRKRCRYVDSSSDLTYIMDPVCVTGLKKHYPDRCVYILLSPQVTMVSNLSGPRLRLGGGGCWEQAAGWRATQDIL